MEIRDLTVKVKLLLLLSLPILALFCFVIHRVVTDVKNLKIAQAVDSTVQHSLKISQLISTLQAERGASGVVLASKGGRFQERLAGLRLQTDLALNELQQLGLSIWPIIQSEKADLRAKVDGLTIESSESAARYTKLIADLIALDRKAEQALEHLTLSRKLATLNMLIETKERAGRERAILGIVFTAKYSQPSLVIKYVISPTHFWFEPVALKSCSSKFGATGSV